MNGPERIAAAFARAAAEDRAALIVFLAAGDPDYHTTVELARTAVAAGADIIELGSPFSDPLADGPVIQSAYERALAGEATTAATLECAARVAAATGAPVVLMVALNCVLAYGTDRFCQDAAEAGVSGLLIPDLPVDDAASLRQEAHLAGLGTVFLTGPDTSIDRTRQIAAITTGFVYVMRHRGVTGAGAYPVDLRRRVAEARAAGPAPVAVGFGIASAADAASIAGVADGIIVGSALVDTAFRAGPGEAVGELVRALRRAMAPAGKLPQHQATGQQPGATA